MKTITVLSPPLIQAHVAAQDIRAIYGKPRNIRLASCNGKKITSFTLLNEDNSSGVQCTLWYPFAGFMEYAEKEIVFFASKRKGISIVKGAGGSSWLWITEAAALFPKNMFVAHMQTKDTEVKFT